jgi:CBS domain containing-hemolysin-like protein
VTTTLRLPAARRPATGGEAVMEWLLLGVAVVLVAANAVFVAAEFAFVTVDRATVERRAQAGDRRSAGLLTGLRSLSTQLSGAQLGITVTSLVVGFLAEPSLAALLRGPLGLTGLPDGAAAGVSLLLALAIASGFQMIFGELVPKNWAITEPLRVGRVVAGAQRGFSTVVTRRPGAVSRSIGLWWRSGRRTRPRSVRRSRSS